jgi:sugar-specific transcriptional regulator TrmB
MDSNEENIKTLIDFGLTGVQARIYLSLLRIGTSPIKETANAAKVARPDVYRALATLLELGLVEKVIPTPAQYKPVPIIDGVCVLMSRRASETVELNRRVTNLVKSHERKSVEEFPNHKDQFILIPNPETLPLEIKKIAEKAQKNICAIYTWKKFLNFFMQNSEVAKEALRRNVAIQILTEDIGYSNFLNEIQSLEKFPLFEIKFLHTPPRVGFTIFDGEEILLVTSPDLDYSDSPSLGSSNHSLIELAKAYFDNAWKKATKIEHVFQKK